MSRPGRSKGGYRCAKREAAPVRAVLAALALAGGAAGAAAAVPGV